MNLAKQVSTVIGVTLVAGTLAVSAGAVSAQDVSSVMGRGAPNLTLHRGTVKAWRGAQDGVAAVERVHGRGWPVLAQSAAPVQTRMNTGGRVPAVQLVQGRSPFAHLLRPSDASDRTAVSGGTDVIDAPGGLAGGV